MSFLRYSFRSRFLVFLAFVSAALSFVSLQQPASSARAASSEYNVADPSPAGVSGGLAVPASCELNRTHGNWCKRMQTGESSYCIEWSNDGDSATWGGGNYGKSCNGVCPGSTGTIGCDGSCTNVSPPPPAGYGTTCNSAANNCGTTTSGTIGCSGCTAVRPADVVLGSACNSLPNNCDDTNPGTMTCSGCNATPPANRACTDGCTTNGNFCSSGNRIIWKCGCTSSPGPGWVDQNNGCFQLNTGSDATCSAPCTGGSGSFCNGGNNHTIDWICGCTTSPGPGWVDQNNGCFQRDTGTMCSTGGCPSGQCETSPGVCGSCGSYPAPQAYCGPSRARNSSPTGKFTNTADWLPNGTSDWFEFNCADGYGGKMWVFQDPIGPVPSKGIYYGYGSDPTNGTPLLYNSEYFHELRVGNADLRGSIGGTLSSPYDAYHPAGNGGGPSNWDDYYNDSDNAAPFVDGYTRIDLRSGPLTNHTTFRVICADSSAKKVSSADCRIGVQGSNTCPSASITAPTNGANFSNGVNITFSGTAADLDGDPIAGYEWRDGGISGTLLSTAANFSISTLAPGQHTVYFRAKDSNNLWSCISPSVTFTISTIGNAAPDGHITLPDGSPAGPTSVPAGTAFQLQGYGNDPDGEVKAYEWREGTLAQCQSHSGGTVLGGCDVAGNCPLTGNGLAHVSAIKSVTLPVGTHLLYFSVMDNSGPSGNNPSQLDGVWSTNCESRLLTVWDAPPPAPVLSRACFADLGTGKVMVHLGFDEAAPTTATMYNVLLNYLGNDDAPAAGDSWWLKPGGDDFKLFGYVGPPLNYLDLPINHPIDPALPVDPNDPTGAYFWGVQSIKNASGLVSTMTFDGPFLCSKRYLSICNGSCSAGTIIAWDDGPLGTDDGGGLLTIKDTESPQNIVACFGPNKSCSNPNAAANATVGFANRTGSYTTAWAKTSDAANAVTLSSNPSYGPPPDSLPFRTLTPNSVTWPGSTAYFKTTLGAYTLDWSVYVEHYCEPAACEPEASNTCNGKTFWKASPTPGCPSVPPPGADTECTGSRICDFNWKEVAP